MLLGSSPRAKPTTSLGFRLRLGLGLGLALALVLVPKQLSNVDMTFETMLRKRSGLRGGTESGGDQRAGDNDRATGAGGLRGQEQVESGGREREEAGRAYGAVLKRRPRLAAASALAASSTRGAVESRRERDSIAVRCDSTAHAASLTPPRSRCLADDVCVSVSVSEVTCSKSEICVGVRD